MKIKDNTYQQTPCIWIEEGDFEIDIEKDQVQIVCNYYFGYSGIGTERMTISREKLLELLHKLDGV